MRNALNVRVSNGISNMAQGNTASTVILELLDENMLPMPYLDGNEAKVSLIDASGVIRKELNLGIFDSSIEFALDSALETGIYETDVRTSISGKQYVFPKNQYKLRITRSANGSMTDVVTRDGVEIVRDAVIEMMQSEMDGLLNHAQKRDNPHAVTKSQVGLSNVSNARQATKTEFDAHVGDIDAHISSSEKDKLSGIEDGAQKNDVQSVNGKVGEVSLNKSDVSLGNVLDFGVATQLEAEEGIVSFKYMTPQRTKQAIDALGDSGGGGAALSDVLPTIPINISNPGSSPVSIVHSEGFGFSFNINLNSTTETLPVDTEFMIFDTAQHEEIMDINQTDTLLFSVYDLSTGDVFEGKIKARTSTSQVKWLFPMEIPTNSMIVIQGFIGTQNGVMASEL